MIRDSIWAIHIYMSHVITTYTVSDLSRDLQMQQKNALTPFYFL